MSKYVPPDMISLAATLGRIAEALCPEAWSLAKPEARNAFAEHDAARQVPFGFWTSSRSLGTKSYSALRPLLASGTLPSSIRKLAGPPEAIEAASWQARGADRVEDLLNGFVSFTTIGGTTERGDILIKAADLDSVIFGQPVSMTIISSSKASKEETTKSPSKAGRRPNPDADKFWIEICRRHVYEELAGDQAKCTEQMADWSARHMNRPYDNETVRKKISAMWKILEWR